VDYDDDDDEGPEIAGLEPIVVEVEEGKAYTWCQCGRSEEQPWCDGVSHLGSAYNGQIFRPQRTGKVRLCTCKRTKRPPYCDESHRDLIKAE
jgi:CDGSH-type Zn-finger protein